MDFNDNNQPVNDAGFETASAPKESFDTQQNSAANAESNDTPPTRSKIEIKKREAQLIEAQRHKWRMFSPENVYFYRHVTPSIFASIFHFITLICSGLLIVSFYRLIKQVNVSEIEGIGAVSELTLIDYLSMVVIFIIIFSGMRILRSNLKDFPIKRYWLAMMANTFNRIVFNHLKICIYILSFSGIALLTSEEWSDKASSLITNGVYSDYSDVILVIISVTIFYRSFRFCFKSLSS